MQYKRIIIACLIVVLALCASVFAVSAAETTPLKVSVGVADATPAVLQSGETFDVSISIDSNPGLGVFQVELQYDAENLEYTGNKNGTVFTDPSGILQVTTEGNVVKYEYIGINSDKTGTLVTLTFKAKTTISPNGACKIDTEKMAGANTDNLLFYGALKGGEAITLEGNPDSIHTHTLTAQNVDATCVDDAYTRYTCTAEKCNYVYDEVKANTAKGHTPGAEATCTTAQVCTVCNVELAPAKGHTPGAEATCTTNQTCTVCNVELAPAKGHTPGAEATCTTAQVCTVCNTELVAANGHTPGAEATCTTAQVCTVCNTELVAAKGHTPGAEATCTTAQVCTVCNTELVAAKGHTPGAEATCTTNQTCTVCNTELVAAKGHTPGAEATCTTNQTCTVCNTELAPALGHKAEKIPAVEPTYKAEGATEGEKCSVCGTVLKAPEVIEKKSSAWIWITVICSVVVIGGGVAALIVVLNKKKKSK